ncbi:MAG: hypothetical protein EA401_07385 [Planctomycetota bacterium]|nr:MAG: hypothetical protein EA401_07385 [Planctomycetota bacterium]
MLMRTVTGLLLCLCAVTSLHAVSMEARTLICPITNRPFTAEVLQVRSANDLRRGMADADMGADSDGCRHTSGVSEYATYVVTSPWSYFSALSIEWDERGRFRGYLPPNFSEWIRSRDGFHSELVTDRQQRYQTYQRVARESGRSVVPFEDWEMPQRDIPVEKRYRLAIATYHQRRFPSSTIAKVALNGAWALRVQMNTPIYHTRLSGGYEEVDDRLQRHLKTGDTFDLDKWTEVYREIFHRARLTDAGFFVAGNTYLGFQARLGDVEGMQETLRRLTDRFQGRDGAGFDVLRVLTRGQRNLVRQSYLPFLEQAAHHFTQALRNEEIPRPRMPEAILAIAESHRRIGNFDQAMAWYTALARMGETQPRIRSEIRAADGVPSSEAPYLLSLGWQADEYIAKMRERGIEYHSDPEGPDGELINAIIHQGLGTEDYVNPQWEPTRGGSLADTEQLLDQTGKALLDYHFRVGVWPDSLDSMWVDGYVRNRNIYNRFHCPVTGKKLRYLQPPDPAPQRTVLVATAEAIPGPDGDRYGVFLANNTIHWLREPMLPGEVLTTDNQ